MNGVDGYEFAIKFCDYSEPGPSEGDHIVLVAGDDLENTIDWQYIATLEGGSIKIHWPNPNKPS